MLSLQGMEVRVCLRDMWVDQQVEPGDTVNVVGGRSLPDPTCTTFEVTANEGLLIVHPDVLLSGECPCVCAERQWVGIGNIVVFWVWCGVWVWVVPFSRL